MIQPGRLDLALKRWTPFVYVIDFVGYDLSASNLVAQFRKYRDQAIAPLISLMTQANPTAEGISISVTTVDGLPTSSVQLRINETTIEGLDFTFPRGGDLDLVWDLHITINNLKSRFLEGDAIVSAGVTQ